MKHICLMGAVTISLVACGKSDDNASGGGKVDSSKGAHAGKLTAQEHKSPDGKLTVKGSMPAAWKPREIQNGRPFALTQPHDGATPPAQLAVTAEVAYPAATPEALAAQKAADAPASGYDVVTPPKELAPGRWGYVLKTQGVQWMPGIDMFVGHAYWMIDDKQHADCWVIWNSKSPDGALELCKDLEVTAPPLS